jgi:hypothetical protein
VPIVEANSTLIRSAHSLVVLHSQRQHCHSRTWHQMLLTKVARGAALLQHRHTRRKQKPQVLF